MNQLAELIPASNEYCGTGVDGVRYCGKFLSIVDDMFGTRDPAFLIEGGN